MGFKLLGVLLDPGVGVIAGDHKGNGFVDAGDAASELNYLCGEDSPPEPMEAGDVNCDGALGVVCKLNYLYRDGPLPCCYRTQ